MRVPNIYFEPESRQLQRARLEHLLSFSDLVILIIAEQGLGRTYLLSQLKPQQNPIQPNWVHLSPEAAVDVTTLLKSLTAQLGLSCEPNNRARLTALHHYAQELEETDQQLHICVDDADFLSDNALELLINFSKVDSAAPQLVLSGLPEFEQRFFDREFNRLVEGSLHVEHLQAYTAEEARAFVDAHLVDGRQLKDSQYRRLLLESQGRPDRIKAALAKLLSDTMVRSGAKSGLVNRWYWAGIALVASTTLGAIGYFYLPLQQVEPPAPIEIPIPTVTQANTGSESDLIEARSELSRRLAEQEKRLAEAAALSQPAEQSSVRAPSNQEESLGSAELDRSTPGVSVSPPNPAPATERPAPESATSTVASELAPIKTTALASVASVAESETAPESDSASEPMLAAVQSDAPVVASDPEVSVGAIQTAPIQQTDVGAEAAQQQAPQPNQLPPGAELGAVVPEPEPAAPTLSAVKLETSVEPAAASSLVSSAESETARFSPDIEAVLAWPTTDVTIQLLAAREEASADKLIARYGASVELLKLSYPYKGAPRFTVVTGHYASRAAANQVVTGLPAGLRNLKPWIRSVTGLKTELNSALNP